MEQGEIKDYYDEKAIEHAGIERLKEERQRAKEALENGGYDEQDESIDDVYDYEDEPEVNEAKRLSEKYGYAFDGNDKVKLNEEFYANLQEIYEQKRLSGLPEELTEEEKENAFLEAAKKVQDEREQRL